MIRLLFALVAAYGLAGSSASHASDMVCCEQLYDCGQSGECRTSYGWMPYYACTKVYNGKESSASNCEQ